MTRKLLLWVWCACIAAAAPPAQLDEWTRLTADGEKQVLAGDYPAALQLYRRALDSAAAFGPTDIHLISTLDSVGNIYGSLGKWVDAEQHYRRAMRIVDSTMGRENITYAMLMLDLGTMFGNASHMDRAEPILHDALALLARILPANDSHTALARISYAGALLTRREFGEAEEQLRRAVTVLDASRDNQIRLGSAYNTLGLLAADRGQYEEARRFFQQAADATQRIVGDDHPAMIVPLTNLATVYSDLHRGAEAEAIFQRVISLGERKLGTDHPAYGRVLANYAAFLRTEKRKEEAKSVAARSAAVMRDSERRNGAGMTVDVAAFRR